jgi:hypothetical protein
MSYNPSIAKFTLEQVIGYSAPQVIPIKLISSTVLSTTPTPIAVYFVTSASDGEDGFEIYNTVQRVSESDFYTDSSGYMVINASLQFIMESGSPMIIPRNTEYNCIAYVQFNNSQTSFYSDDTLITSGPSKPVIDSFINLDNNVIIYLNMSDQSTALIQEYTVVLSYTNISEAVVEPIQNLVLQEDSSGNYYLNVINLVNEQDYWLVVIANGDFGNSEVSEVIHVTPTATGSAPENLIAWGDYAADRDIIVQFNNGLSWTPLGGPYTVIATANGVSYNVGIVDVSLGVDTYIATLRASIYGFLPGQTYSVSVSVSNSAGEGASSTVDDVLCFERPNQPDIDTLVVGNGTLAGTFLGPDNRRGGVSVSAANFIVELYEGGDASGTLLDTITVPCTDASSYNFEFTGPLDMSANYTVRLYEEIDVPTDFSGFPITDLSGNPVTPYPAEGIVTGASDYESVWLNFTPADPPTDLNGTPGDTFVDLTWVEPEDLGTGDLYGYRIGVYSDVNLVNQVGDFIDISGNGTFYSVSGLTNGTRYFFVVKTITEDWNDVKYYSGNSQIVEVTPNVIPPYLPEPLTLIPSETSITATWSDASAGSNPVSSYECAILDFSSNAPDASSWVDVGLINTTDFSGLSNGVRYYIFVRAVSDPSGYTFQYSNTITDNALVLLTPPILPEPLTLTPRDTYIDASWNAAIAQTHPVTSYEYSFDGVNWTDTGNTDTYYRFSNLNNGESYTIYIRAVAPGPTRTESDPISATATPEVIPPTLDSFLTLVAGDTYIDASWDAAIDGSHPVTSYQWSLNDASWNDIALDTNVRITELNNYENYTVYVRAVSDPSGYTPTVSTPSIYNSAEPTVDPPHAPEDLQAVPLNNGMVVSWNAPANKGTFNVISYYECKFLDYSSNTVVTPTDFSANLDGWFTITEDGSLSNYIFTLSGLENAKYYQIFIRGVTVGEVNQFTDPLYGVESYVIQSPSGLPIFTDASGNPLVDASGNVDTNGAIVLTVNGTVATAYVIGNGSMITNYTLIAQDLTGTVHKYRTGGTDGYPRPEPVDGIYTIIFNSFDNENIPDAGYTMAGVFLIVSNTVGQELGTTLIQ